MTQAQDDDFIAGVLKGGLGPRLSSDQLSDREFFGAMIVRLEMQQRIYDKYRMKFPFGFYSYKKGYFELKAQVDG